jgi:hypothetical protein
MVLPRFPLTKTTQGGGTRHQVACALVGICSKYPLGHFRLSLPNGTKFGLETTLKRHQNYRYSSSAWARDHEAEAPPLQRV